jgi:AhpD family alkylhydroperoxidase
MVQQSAQGQAAILVEGDRRRRAVSAALREWFRQLIAHGHIPPSSFVIALTNDDAFAVTKETQMKARMKNPGLLIPEAGQHIYALWMCVEKSGFPAQTLSLVHMRISQINGCSACIDGGWRHSKKAGESDERLFSVAAWREAPYFSAAERAALALAESVTRLSDREDAVPDAIWDEAARHYDERMLAALVVAIATVNVFNRINVTTRQVAGTRWDA